MESKERSPTLQNILDLEVNVRCNINVEKNVRIQKFIKQQEESIALGIRKLLMGVSESIED